VEACSQLNQGARHRTSSYDAHREFLFLSELRFLSDGALRHVEAIERIASEWTGAQHVATSYAANPRITRKPRKEREADREQFQDAMSVLGRTQGEFFVHLEALLAVLGRLSLTLFPQAEDKNDRRHVRAQQLRAALEIGDIHPLRDRLFRNKWLHHDEVLDDLPESFQHAQRFTTRGRVTESDRQSVIRLCLIDEQTVIHAIAGEFSIPLIADSVRDLERRVHRAIETWAHRHATELGISDNDA
jgi:hypothetical protein